MWTVTIVHHQDDYKCRGDPWMNIKGPIIFDSEIKAETYLCGQLCTTIHNLKQLCDEDYVYLLSCDEDESDIYYDSNGFVKQKYRSDLTILEKLIKPMLKGEFVPCVCAWKLNYCEMSENKR